ncbi:uncharacterized protein LOC120327744 isoform X1 [Styela clava]|uniref:uncharacterized protein LOC120327744 isoform X1 n=1 Tax=Styela clava TaxID=7725 RepID=UPI00193AB174|nr:uncharacterized protein LOC120327744 isoform X1 [Styela clava]
MKQPWWKYAIFCFHPKFDTGTWTITAAFSTVVIFSALFFITLAFSAPKCFCPEIWEHIDALSPEFKAIYAIAIFLLLGVVIVSVLCMYGTFKAQSGKLIPYILTMTVISIGTLGGSVFIFIQLAYIDQFLLFDNSTYWNLAKMLSEFKYRTQVVGGLINPLFVDPPNSVLKEDLISNLEGMWASINILLKNFLNIDMGDELNLNMLLDAALRDEILILMGAGKRVMKISAVLLLLGMNWLFFASLIVTFAHWRRLKSGVVTHFSPVPNIILSQKLTSESYRSTESDTLSDDYSGLSLRELKRMKSRQYRRAGSRTGSSRSSKRLYDIGRLEVEEKFPRENFL